jgi:hypothetical protein
MGHEEEDSTSTGETKRSDEEDDLAKRGSKDDEYSQETRTKRTKLGEDAQGVDVSKTTTTDARNSSTGTGGNNAAVVVSPPPPLSPSAPMVHLVLDRFPNSAGRSEELDRNHAMMRDFVPPPAGTRLAVHWDIVLDMEVPEDAAAGAAPVEPPASQKTVSRWWKATLLPHDGRQMLVSIGGNKDQAKTTPTDDDDVVLADVRVLEYDALPELGYDAPSREDVIFYGSTLLIQYDGGTNADDGDNQEKEEDAPPADITLLEYKIWSNDDAEEENNAVTAEDAAAMMDPAETYLVCRRNSTDIEDLVNETLTASLAMVMDRFQLLPAANQLQLAEKIGIKKQRLVSLLREHVEQHGVVSEQDMRILLAQVMAE